MNIDIEKIKALYRAWGNAEFTPEEDEIYEETETITPIAFIAGYKAALETYDPDAITVAPSFDHYWQIVLNWAQDMDIIKKLSIHEMKTLSERLQSITANTLGTIDPDAVRRENIMLAEKLRQYLPHCGKQDMTNGDRELVEWVEAIMNAGKE